MSSQSQLIDDDELTGSCVPVVDGAQSADSCANCDADAVCCTTDSVCSLTAHCDVTVSQKRRLSPSLDVECVNSNGLLAKSTKLF